MDLKNFFKPPQKGGPTEAETMQLMDDLGFDTLKELVTYVRKENNKATAAETVTDMTKKQNVISTRFQKKSKGGYIKKYAKGGGVRKVR